MNYYKVFLISCAISFAVIFIIRSIIRRRQMRNYESLYSLVVDAQNGLMLARKLYYSARFAESDEEMTSMKDAAENLYDVSLLVLDSEEIQNQINELPDEELRDYLNEIIDSPRYPLI